MAYPNNNKRKPVNNYFTQQIQRNGVNFLDSIRDADLLERDSIRIFRDLSRGNIELEKHANYFLDPRLQKATITAAYSKFVLNSTSKAGLEMLVNSPSNTMYPSAPSILEYYTKSAEAYYIIFESMQAIQATGDLSILMVLLNKLHGYRNFI